MQIVEQTSPYVTRLHTTRVFVQNRVEVETSAAYHHSAFVLG
jgi:hypothetical protein